MFVLSIYLVFSKDLASLGTPQCREQSSGLRYMGKQTETF